jgi:hypothetical protein
VVINPDIAGQCKRLRRHANNCTPSQEERGLDLDGMAFAFYGAADTLERQASEIERLRELLRCIRDTPANEFDAVDVANRIRAALTGEDHD